MIERINIGDYIRAVSNDGFTVLSGKLVNYTDLREMEIIQPNGTRRWIYSKHFKIELVKRPRTALQLELEELIALYKKDGFSPEYIRLNSRKAFDKLRDPEPELKGDLDT